MPFGWTGRILEVDLTARTTGIRDAMAYARDYIGGRALASRIAWDEIPAGIDAYDPENRIIIGTGPLSGTLSPTSGRTIMASLSPRAYPGPWYTHSTLGGWFGPELKYAGFDGIVVYGRADSPVYLEVRDGTAQLIDANDLWGLDARETQLALKKRVDEQAQVLTIGPAGENLVRFATVQHSEDNAAGHSGFGAVWGSKNLKAAVVRGTGGVPVADPDALLREVLADKFRATPYVTVVRNADLTNRYPVCSQACLFNCTVGRYSLAADGRRMPAHCAQSLWRNGAMGMTEYSGGGVEVPPGVNFETRKEASLYELCNSLGLDIWFRFVMQPWLIRCKQLGVDEIRGYPIEPEDDAWFEGFMVQLAHRQGLGDLFAEDMRRVMDELEDELPGELIRLGRELAFGFGFPAHREGRLFNRQPLPFWVISALMYASTSRDPTIGTHHSSLHLADFLLADREVALRQFRVLSEKVWGYVDALEPTMENKAPVAIWSQHQNMLIDSLPLCDFAFPKLVRPFESREDWRKAEDIVGDLDLDLRLFVAVTGVELAREEAMTVAERAFTLERLLLARAGRGREMEEALASHFELPCPDDGTFVDEAGFSRLLDEYYTARGWDLEFGWPQADRLKALGLEEAIPVIEALRRPSDAEA
jgi:aldehyde:ferredoxin oxidoreductase